MRIAFTLILLVASTPVQAATVTIEFSTPAQIWGDDRETAANDAVALDLIEQGIVRIEVAPGTRITETERNQTTLQAERAGGFHDEGTARKTEYHTTTGGVIELRPANSDGIAISTESRHLARQAYGTTSFSIWTSQDTFEVDAPWGENFRQTYHEPVNWTLPGVVRSTTAVTELIVAHQNLSSVAWSNAQVSCLNVQPCPRSDNQTAQTATQPATRRTVINVQIQQPKEISITAEQASSYVLASSWTVHGSMAARLPEAWGQDCQSVGCDGRKTIRLDGNFSMTNIHIQSAGRLTADIDGQGY